MTAKELALNTFEYYESDPSRRALDQDGYCCYKTKDGKTCAVGRWIDFDRAEALKLDIKLDVSSLDVIATMKNGKGIDEILIPDAQGINLEIWCELQYWHDLTEFWNGRDSIGRERCKNKIIELCNKHYNETAPNSQ